jgi:hypothetical protein
MMSAGKGSGFVQEGLPLGFIGSGLLLSVFTVIKSSVSILLMTAKAGSKDGFPFLFETVLIFPFFMQAIVYTSQTCINLGIWPGFTAIREAAVFMGPCLFYACFISSTTLLETFSLQFVFPSTFVVLKQLTMVVLAIGEVLVLGARPSRKAWMLIVAQVLCVAIFQYTSSDVPEHHHPGITPHHTYLITSSPHLGGIPVVHVHHKRATLFQQEQVVRSGILGQLGMTNWATGMTACLISVCTGGFGSILQQRFMQRQAKGVPVSIKLLYQHIIELTMVIMVVQSRPLDRHHLWRNGFFSGWNHWTCLVTVTMWLAMLSGSAIGAYISALSGAFAIAVAVALTAVLESTLFGRYFSWEQFILMGMVCAIAMLYTRERVAMLDREDEPEQRRLISGTP